MQAVKSAPKPAQPLTYYHELDNTYYSITENTFIGQVYSLFGLQSIADFEEVSSDYPQLSAEAIISADPDFIFLGDGNFGESPEISRCAARLGVVEGGRRRQRRRGRRRHLVALGPAHRRLHHGDFRRGDQGCRGRLT